LFLRDSDFVHVCKVLRSKIGDMIYVRVGNESLLPMTISKIDKAKKIAILQTTVENIKNAPPPMQCTQEGGRSHKVSKSGTYPDDSVGVCTLRINQHNVSATSINFEHKIEYTLFQFIAKSQTMELIIRQATECGVKHIIPVIGEFSQKNHIAYFSKSDAKKIRIEKIVKEARQQSGSPVETIVHEAMHLEEACIFWKKISFTNNLNNKSLAFVLSELDSSTASSAISSVANFDSTKSQIKRIALAVGSEGGISRKELKILEQSSFNAIHFPGNILRCETAAIYGIASLQTNFGV
ncbi:MAG: RNA methyltransferase, partial [Treponema sp.]|nr:RNA methyltransferase [Treponema sp.]